MGSWPKRDEHPAYAPVQGYVMLYLTYCICTQHCLEFSFKLTNFSRSNASKQNESIFLSTLYIQSAHGSTYLNSKPFSKVPRFLLWYCSLARKTSTVSPCLSTCSGTVISWLFSCPVDDDKGWIRDQASRTNPCTNEHYHTTSAGYTQNSKTAWKNIYNLAVLQKQSCSLFSPRCETYCAIDSFQTGDSNK